MCVCVCVCVCVPRQYLMYSSLASSTSLKNSGTPVPSSDDTPTVCKGVWLQLVALQAITNSPSNSDRTRPVPDSWSVPGYQHRRFPAAGTRTVVALSEHLLTCAAATTAGAESEDHSTARAESEVPAPVLLGRSQSHSSTPQQRNDPQCPPCSAPPRTEALSCTRY